MAWTESIPFPPGMGACADAGDAGTAFSQPSSWAAARPYPLIPLVTKVEMICFWAKA